MNAQELRRDIEALLAAQHVMSLATAGQNAQVHAASLFYALDGLSLVWTSDPGTRHSQHLEGKAQGRRHHRARLRRLPRRARPADLGVGAAPGDASGSRDSSAMMRARFPFLEQLASGPGRLREAWARAGFYRLDPERITLIDNSRGFGHKATLQVSADGAVALADEHPIIEQAGPSRIVVPT